MTAFRSMAKRSAAAALILPVTFLGLGCSTPVGHAGAFSAKTALTGNTTSVDLTVDQGFRVAKQILIRQGFTLESTDVGTGLIRASRIFQDPAVPNQSYNINASAYLFPSGASATSITLSASEQTILHRSWHTWWHLLWVIPLFPIGTEYQTVVIREGNVTDPAFYGEFFAAFKAVGADLKAADLREASRIAAEKFAAAERAAAEKAAADKLAAELAAAEKAAADQAAARAAAEKAAAAKAAARAAAEKAAADRAAAERTAALKALTETRGPRKKPAKKVDKTTDKGVAPTAP